MSNKNVKNSIILIAVIISLNVGLAFAKLYVGLASNSLCVMLDSINSFLDVATCVITIIALALIVKAKGYGRSEYLAGFVVSAVAVILGGLFLIRSVNRIAMPEPVWVGATSIAIMSVAVVIKLGVGLACFFLNKKFNSVAVKAIMLDSFLDVGVSTTSLFANSSFKSVQKIIQIIFPKPKKACLCEILGITESTNKLEWIGPKFFNIWGVPKKKKLKIFTCK